MIHRMDPPADPAARADARADRADARPRRRAAAPTTRAGRYEIKWDGVRAIAYSPPGELRLESRNLNDITDSYPGARPLCAARSARTAAVLDGEIVAFDADGRPSFSALQQRMQDLLRAHRRGRRMKPPP